MRSLNTPSLWSSENNSIPPNSGHFVPSFSMPIVLTVIFERSTGCFKSTVIIFPSESVSFISFVSKGVSYVGKFFYLMSFITIFMWAEKFYR